MLKSLFSRIRFVSGMELFGGIGKLFPSAEFKKFINLKTSKSLE